MGTRRSVGRGLGLACSLVLVGACGDDGVGTTEVASTGTTAQQSTSSAPVTETGSETPTTGTTQASAESLGTDGETGDSSTGDPTTGGPDPVCGDGVIDAGEACDNGANNGDMNSCKADCSANVCGDGAVGPGEGCDDGNQTDDDECTNACALASCGDGIVAATEACDDGNQENADACTNACTLASCGDGFMQEGELCDEGPANSDNAACTLGCQDNVCGDGKLFNTEGGTEACDDGVDNGPGKSCNAMCALNVCGDGDIGPGEQCDDKNVVGGDGCAANCELEECGNKKIDPGETCDDGKNGNNDDGCTDLCQAPVCGDSFVQASLAEQCDLGPANSNTGACTLMCKNAACGDGLIQQNVEQCDDGANNGNNKACKANCTTNVCGDGFQGPGEACDDGNMDNLDGCTNVCKLASCGDGFKQPGEACDLGANNSNTGTCTLACKAPVCGDSFVQPSNNEVCDDGNAINTDACVACKAAKCGDGFVNAGVEQCDDGNVVSNDGCSATCTSEAIGKLYLTSSNGSQGFYGYTIANNTWATLSNPPTVTYSQITNDGKVVYLLGNNNVIYQYTPGTGLWAATAIPGPSAQLAAQPIGFFKWTTQGFFYLKDGSTALYAYKNNAWSSTNVTAGSSAGSWDKAKNELYIRTWTQLGFQVYNTANSAVVRTIVDATGVGENSRTGSLSGAFFYGRTFTGTLQKLDAITGAKSDTGQQPASDHMASDTDVTTGQVYLHGYGGTGQKFQRYTPGNNTITTLADSVQVSNHSTITVMIP